MAQELLFGKYRSLRRLVACQAGEVHLAQIESGGPQRRVIVKILHPPATPERTGPFCAEAKATAPTLHPGILRPLDFGVDAGRCFVVTEALSCVPLSDLLSAATRARRRLSYEFVAAVASQVCAGLAHAHSRNSPDGRPLKLVHSNLSPKHIVVAEGGVVKTVGFAFARGRGLLEPATRTDQGGVQTSYYVAPEQLVSGREPDGRSDLFSLGAVLWELVAGKGPFLASTLTELDDVYEQPAAPLTLVARDVPLDLADAVSRALARDPAARYSSADEMRRAFDAVLARRGSHHPAAVVDQEFKTLQHLGLKLPTWDGPDLPEWYRETLGFDPTEGELPDGALLEEDRGSTLQVEVSPAAAEAHPGSLPLSPDDAWGSDQQAVAPEPVPRLPPPSQPSRMDASFAAAATTPPPDEALATPAPARSSVGKTIALVAVTAVACGAGGFFGAGFLAARKSQPATPAAEVIPAGQVQVFVTSTPPGAKLFVDGVDTGMVAPAKMLTAAGRKHAFVLKLADHLDWQVEMEPRALEADKVEAALVKAARIQVTSEPPGAEVEVDDLPAFTAPGRSGALKSGAHKVVVKKAGFVPHTREVSVRDSEEPAVAVTLVPAAEVAVKSLPSGAEIYVDGNASGLRSPATVLVPAGKACFVSVRRPDCIGGSKKVAAMEQGKSAAVELALEDVVHAELIKRTATRQKDLAAAQKKLEDARKRFEAKRIPANEKAMRDAQDAADDIEAELQELQELTVMHGSLRR
ncbi:MAG: PEGA domain-containing protein [Myxococcales bacterium]